jgi:hypothetical protein
MFQTGNPELRLPTRCDARFLHQFTHRGLYAIALLREQIGVELQPLNASTPVIGIHRAIPIYTQARTAA